MSGWPTWLDGESRRPQRSGVCGFCTIQLNLHAYLRYRVCGCRLIKLLFMHVVVLAVEAMVLYPVPASAGGRRGVSIFLSLIHSSRGQGVANSVDVIGVHRVGRRSAEQHWPCHRLPSDGRLRTGSPIRRPGFRKSGLASVYTRASRPPNCALRLSVQRQEGCNGTTRAMRCHVG